MKVADINDGVCLVKLRTGEGKVEWFEADAYHLNDKWLELDTVDGRASSKISVDTIEWFKFEPRVKTNKKPNTIPV